MVSLTQIQASQTETVEYLCLSNLNLYDSSALQRLATQAVAGRQLRIIEASGSQALQVQLCEDDYPGWLALEDLDLLEVAERPYRARSVSAAEIQNRLPQVLTFCDLAMQQPNCYLWGGTAGPNYDCSGLVQAGFMAFGVWLPRDAYQQEAFTEPVALSALQLGDLIFFGSSERATHVSLYLGNGRYIHSSGKELGRNGIGIDRLPDARNPGEAIDQVNDPVSDPVSQTYARQLRGAGRVVSSYLPR